MKTEYCTSNISYTTWIEPLTIYEVKDDTVFIFVSLKASIEHIHDKYLLPFRVCIAEVTGKEYQVEFVTEDNVQVQKEAVAVKKAERRHLRTGKLKSEIYL